MLSKRLCLERIRFVVLGDNWLSTLYGEAIAVTYSKSKILFIQAKLADTPADESSHLDRNRREISRGKSRCGIYDLCDD